MTDYQLSDFWNIPPQDRPGIILQAIQRTHTWHYPRNRAYQRVVSGRGIGPTLDNPADLPLLLRPTAQTFKSYIELLGTPFAQDYPQAFLNWLADQLSIELPQELFSRFRARYPNLEALLKEIEKVFASFGLELSTSSGTSGRSTIMVRDQDSITKTVESFYLAFQRYFGMRADHRAIFIMPRLTRIAMARMASFSVRRIGLPEDRVHYTIPFAAYPDQVRIRAGRTYREGWRGLLEQRLVNPFMNWAYEHQVTPQTIQRTIQLLEQAEAQGDKVLLFGGWSLMHGIALELRSRSRVLKLPASSVLGTGGGFKERYPYTPNQIRQDLAATIQFSGPLANDGQPVPMRDTYGMAEGNWAAMQCSQGNYHVPPWIYAVTLDENDRLQIKPESTGLLAFFDPFGGGQLFPAFFKTADQVHQVNGSLAYDPGLNCACGDAGAYLTQGSIQRVDLLDEAGCAAQV
jgi:hypothetical protein